MAVTGSRGRAAVAVGQVVATETGPTFDRLSFVLNAEAAVEPGQLFYTQSPEGDRAVVIRADTARDVNPHETPEFRTARKVLGIKAVYAPEGSSTVIRREVEAATLEECPITPLGLGEPGPVRTLPRAGWLVFRLGGNDAARVFGLAQSDEAGVAVGEIDGGAPGEPTPAILDYERTVPRHQIVTGRSGSGKSNYLQVFAEENVRLGVPTINFDMTGDFVGFAIHADVGGVNLEPGRSLKVPLALLGEREVMALAPTLTDNQQQLVGYAYNELLREGKDFAVDDLLAKMDAVAPRVKARDETREMAKSRIGYAIRNAAVIGGGASTTDWASLIAKYPFINVPLHLMSLTDARIVVAAVCRQIQSLAKAGKLPRPVVVMIDEAHLLVPVDDDTSCKPVIRELIRIGRHYGVALVLASQFPRDLDRRTIGQANSYLVFALDRTQLDALAGVFSDATEDMVARLPKLPVGTCLVSGGYETVRHALFVRVRERRVRAGGAPTPKFLRPRSEGMN